MLECRHLCGLTNNMMKFVKGKGCLFVIVLCTFIQVIDESEIMR